MRHAIIRILIGVILLITAVVSIFRLNTFSVVFSVIIGVLFLASGIKLYKDNKGNDK